MHYCTGAFVFGDLFMNTYFSGIFYILSPLILYTVAGTVVGAGMEALWTYFLQARVTGQAGTAGIYAATTVWASLRLVIPAGVGLLCLRPQTVSELKRHPGFDMEKGPLVRTRLMPVLPVTAICLSLGINALASWLHLEQGAASAMTGALPGAAGILLQAAIYAMFMPFVEEVLFRGILFSRLEREYGLRAGILLSAALFGIYHGSLVQGIYAFIMGIVFASAYAGTGRFPVPVTLHGLCNLAVLFLQWTDNYSRICSPAWSAAFFAVAAGGFLTLYKDVKKKA